MFVDRNRCTELKKIINKVFNQYNDMSKPVKASIWFAICSFFQKGVSFITTPIFTRILSTEQYGVFSVYSSWYSLISIIATLNLAAGVYNNCMTKFPDKKNVITSSFQGLSTCVTMLLFIIYVINTSFWNDLFQLTTLFVVFMFLELLFVPAYTFWTVSKRYDYEYVPIVVLTVVIAFASPIIGVIAVLSTDHKAEAKVISNVLVQVIIGLVFYIYNFVKGKRFFVKEYWKFALKFNIPLIPHYLSMTVLNQADRIMIGRMVSNGAAAIYSIAYSISYIMSIFTSAINSSLIPYTYKSLRDNNYEGIKSVSNFLIVFVFGISIIAMAFGPEVVLVIGGEQYYDAIWVIPPVAASVYFTFLYPLFANVEFYYEKTIGIMIASCSGAILNIIMNYVFIKIYGYYAAGYTTLFCYMIFAIVHYLFHKKILSSKITTNFQLYNNKTILVLSLSEIIVMFVMIITYKCFFIRYCIIIVLTFSMLKKRKEIMHQFGIMKK